jgi:hypothetical protein
VAGGDVYQLQLVRGLQADNAAQLRAVADLWVETEALRKDLDLLLEKSSTRLEDFKQLALRSKAVLGAGVPR